MAWKGDWTTLLLTSVTICGNNILFEHELSFSHCSWTTQISLLYASYNQILLFLTGELKQLKSRVDYVIIRESLQGFFHLLYLLLILWVLCSLIYVNGIGSRYKHLAHSMIFNPNYFIWKHYFATTKSNETRQHRSQYLSIVPANLHKYDTVLLGAKLVHLIRSSTMTLVLFLSL